MVPPAKITAGNHSQAGAAWPRAGPETIVRLTAYMHTRVNSTLQWYPLLPREAYPPWSTTSS
jgi:hypothetical protein